MIPPVRSGRRLAWVATILLPLSPLHAQDHPFEFATQTLGGDEAALVGLWTECWIGSTGFPETLRSIPTSPLPTVVHRDSDVTFGTPVNDAWSPSLRIDIGDLEELRRQGQIARNGGLEWPVWATTTCMVLAHEIVEMSDFTNRFDPSWDELRRVAERAKSHERGIEAENAMRQARGATAMRDRYCRLELPRRSHSTYILIGPHTEAQFWKDQNLNGTYPIHHTPQYNWCDHLVLPTQR